MDMRTKARSRVAVEAKAALSHGVESIVVGKEPKDLVDLVSDQDTWTGLESRARYAAA